MFKPFIVMAILSLNLPAWSNTCENSSNSNLADIKAVMDQQCNRLNKKSAQQVLKHLHEIQKVNDGFVSVCTSCEDKQFQMMEMKGKFKLQPIPKSQLYQIVYNGSPKLPEHLYMSKAKWDNFEYISLARELNCYDGQDEKVVLNRVKQHNTIYNELLSSPLVREEHQKCLKQIEEQEQAQIRKLLIAHEFSVAELSTERPELLFVTAALPEVVNKRTYVIKTRNQHGVSTTWEGESFPSAKFSVSSSIYESSAPNAEARMVKKYRVSMQGNPFQLKNSNSQLPALNLWEQNSPPNCEFEVQEQ